MIVSTDYINCHSIALHHDHIILKKSSITIYFEGNVLLKRSAFSPAQWCVRISAMAYRTPKALYYMLYTPNHVSLAFPARALTMKRRGDASRESRVEYALPYNDDGINTRDRKTLAWPTFTFIGTIFGTLYGVYVVLQATARCCWMHGVCVPAIFEWIVWVAFCNRPRRCHPIQSPHITGEYTSWCV